MSKVVIKVITSLIVGLALFVSGLVISFNISLIIHGSPPGPVSPLCLNHPLYNLFPYYIRNMFSGNWGVSTIYGTPVINLFMQRLPRTFDLMLLPLIIALFLGFLLGHRSMNAKFRAGNRVVQLLALVVFAIPLVLIAFLLQYTFSYVFHLFPSGGFKSPGYTDPPFKTGFRIIDSLLSGQWYLILDYLYHLILPWITLTLLFTPLTILLVRSYRMNRLKDANGPRSIGSFALYIGFGFAMILLFTFITEFIFSFKGSFSLILTAIQNSDNYVTNGAVFIFLVMFAPIMLFSLLLFIIFQEDLLKRRHRKVANPQSQKGMNNRNTDSENSSETSIKKDGFSGYLKVESKIVGNYLLLKLKSPITLIGSVIVLFGVIISIFPQILTPYSFNDATGFSFNAWMPPSPQHILGTTYNGHDVLARIIYSLSNTMLFGVLVVIMGLVLGLIIGIPLLFVNRILNFPTELALIPIYSIPVLFFILFGNILISFVWFLVPFFVHLVVNSKLSLAAVSKRVIPYIPLLIAIIILLRSLLVFIGYTSPTIIDLGSDMAIARYHLFDAPWAAIFPGIAQFILILGFFMLYAGLQKSPQEVLDLSERKNI